MVSNSRERIDFTPPQTGPLVLPNTPFFSQLVRHAHRPKRLAIRDVNIDMERSYAELLSDAVRLRQALRNSLPQVALERLDAGEEEVCIGVLAPGGYEYVVAILAVMALGAVIVPMTVALPVEEAGYFVNKSRQVAIITSKSAEKLGTSIAEHVNEDKPRDSHQRIQSISVLPALGSQSFIPPHEIKISSGLYLDDNPPGVIIFTSGTSGPPKAAALRRGYIHDASRAIADHFSLSSEDVLLHLLPVHHVTGLAINILPFLLAGATIEFRSGGFDAEWTWNRWRRGGLTVFSAVPTIYMRMMRFFQHQITKLPEGERHEFEKSAKQFRVMMCGTSALPRPVSDFWTQLRDGKPILTRYGSTEVGAVLRVPLDTQDTPDGSVGVVAPGVDLKLVPDDKDQAHNTVGSNGADTEEGEVYVKSPELFSKYLHDEENTAASFDQEGYFKTGDIARREGKFYFIVGRASQDIIKSGGYKISALDIEREILALPYVSEVMVVGVDDMEFGQRVAAVITLREDQDTYSASDEGNTKALTIGNLRDDLRKRLAGYKLPTLLRVMGGDLPKTASGKVLKKVLGPELFPAPGWDKEPAVQVWRTDKAKL